MTPDNENNGKDVLWNTHEPEEPVAFREWLTHHAELNALVPMLPSGVTRQATFSLQGAPPAETDKARPQEQASSSRTLYFPDYVDGGGWSVQLVLSNIGTAAKDATVVVEVFDPAGRPVRDLFDSSGTFKVPSLGNRVLRSSGVGAIRRGWIQVRPDTETVSGLLTYRHTQTGIEVGIEPVELGNHFALFVEESSDIGTGLAIFKPDASPAIELRIRDEAGNDPLGGAFVRWRNFHQRAHTIPEWFNVQGVDTEFLRDFRGLLFLRIEDGSPFAPLGLRFGKTTGSLSAVPVTEITEERGTGAPPTRMEFESSAPPGYTAVSLNDSGRIWGVPTRYTNDSDPGTVAYVLLGKLKGCEFANAEADRKSTVYIKTESLGRLDDYESETVCRRTSRRWTSSWPGVRMTHLLFFDESSPTNTREGVYNAATGKIELSRSTGGGARLEFAEGEFATRRIWENTPPGINVGSPVAAVGGDGLTYTIGGTDARSFVIVPQSGQIRTREEFTYDYETKSRYSVTVGVEDHEANSDTIDVTILIENLAPSCDPPSHFRVNHGDGRLTLRWSPLPDRVGQARVLGYETEIRRGSGGAWGDRRRYLGRNITGMIYADLTNEIGYQVRVRTINAEGDCGWSTPVSGIPTDGLAPKDPDDHCDRFCRDPVGSPDRNYRFLTPERCRHTSNGQILDADCEYENTGPDSGRIFLEFDDPSQGSCEITLAFSSLTAGSFIDECFDAGVNTRVPFDRGFRMPRSTQAGGETAVPRAPRTSEEFDVLAWGRDDLVPGLIFGCPPVFDDCEFSPGFGFRIERDSDTGLPRYIYGEYSYENTGSSQGELTFRAVDGNNYVFTLDFEPSGQMRVAISDPDGGVPVWPGISHLDLSLGAQPILLPVPPSWSAAIAIETDVPGDLQMELASSLTNPFLRLAICPESNPDCIPLNFSRGSLSLGRNRLIVTVEFPARDPEIFDSLEEPERTTKRSLNGSTLVFDLRFTSDGSAEYTLTITKEGQLPTVIEGFADFGGTSINVDDFPEELRLPDDPPQAAGEDRSGVDVAAAISTSRIGPDDVQTFLVNNPEQQTASYSPGDWLEPKDGSHQRMMIVGASQVSAARSADSLAFVAPQFDAPILKVQTSVSPHAPPLFAEVMVLLGHGVNQPAHSTSNSTITRISVVCMQQDHEIPTRGARYFSRPKSAHDDVQRCQRDCVLEETDNIQMCVWRCERSLEGN